MSANFKVSGNVLVPKDSFKSFCNVFAASSELILCILGGKVSLVDDLLGLMSLTSFILSFKATDLPENFFRLSTLLLIKVMLG